MRYFDDMMDKYGFNDGSSVPDDVQEARDLYMVAINNLCEKRGSNTRVVGWNRAGLHNWCFILRCSLEDYKAMQVNHDGAFAFVADYNDISHKWNEPKGDEIYKKVIEDVHALQLDNYITTKVTVQLKKFQKMLAKLK